MQQRRVCNQRSTRVETSWHKHVAWDSPASAFSSPLRFFAETMMGTESRHAWWLFLAAKQWCLFKNDTRFLNGLRKNGLFCFQDFEVIWSVNTCAVSNSNRIVTRCSGNSPGSQCAIPHLAFKYSGVCHLPWFVWMSYWDISHFPST